jgi:hypothetical protein
MVDLGHHIDYVRAEYRKLSTCISRQLAENPLQQHAL